MERYEENEKYLYISSHFFLLPTFMSIYMERYDLLWFFLSILVTSLLRWGNRTTKLFQYIDHNWVKFVFAYICLSLIIIFSKQELDMCCVIYISSIFLSIFFFWLLEWITWIWTTQYAIQLHMLVHFMTVVVGLLLLLLEYDFNETFVYIYQWILEKNKISSTNN